MSAAGNHPIVYVDQPEVLVVSDVRLLCLPWLDRGDVEASEGGYADAVRERYTAAVVEAAEPGGASYKKGQSVLVCHGAVWGGEIRDGQPAVPTSDPSLVLADLTPKGVFNLALFGHYHARQELFGGGCPAYYGGSLFASDYGELVSGHGWGLFECTADDPTHVKATFSDVAQVPRVVIELNASARTLIDVRPMELAADLSVEVSSPKLVEAILTAPVAACAHIKIVAHLDEGDARALVLAESLRKQATALGARSARVELRTTRVTRRRDGAEAVASAPTLADKVAHFCAAGTPPPSELVLHSALAHLDAIETALDAGAAL